MLNEPVDLSPQELMRLKRLTRKTICFSKSEEVHDIVIGLFINRYEFGQEI